MSTELVPFGSDAQSAVTRAWSEVVWRPEPLASSGVLNGVRDVVRASWERSLAARVSPSLAAAPIVLDADALSAAREESDWLAAAHDAVHHYLGQVAGDGHVLLLFDERGCMLTADGDAHVVERLADGGIVPGGCWAEDRVGTNGPGTAIATGAPLHIVGAEHFCERLHYWHCAAVPLRDPATLRPIGAVDISGYRERAHPHLFELAVALGMAIEQSLTAREIERRYLLLEAYHATAARYPGDAVLSVDRAGRVSTHAPSVPAEVIEACAHIVRPAPFVLSGDPAGTPVTLGNERTVTWIPVRQGRTIIGGCFILAGGPLRAGSEGIPFLPEDVRVYARRFFEAGSRELGRLQVLVDPSVYDAMQAYRWPGNVKELKQVVRRVLLSTEGRITVQHLPHAIREAWSGVADLHASAIDYEDATLMRAVGESRTMAAAAKRLGITRSTLYRRLERFGLRPKRVIERQ